MSVTNVSKTKKVVVQESPPRLWGSRIVNLFKGKKGKVIPETPAAKEVREKAEEVAKNIRLAEEEFRKKSTTVRNYYVEPKNTLSPIYLGEERGVIVNPLYGTDVLHENLHYNKNLLPSYEQRRKNAFLANLSRSSNEYLSMNLSPLPIQQRDLNLNLANKMFLLHRGNRGNFEYPV